MIFIIMLLLFSFMIGIVIGFIAAKPNHSTSSYSHHDSELLEATRRLSRLDNPVYLHQQALDRINRAEDRMYNSYHKPK